MCSKNCNLLRLWWSLENLFILILRFWFSYLWFELETYNPPFPLVRVGNKHSIDTSWIPKILVHCFVYFLYILLSRKLKKTDCFYIKTPKDNNIVSFFFTSRFSLLFGLFFFDLTYKKTWKRISFSLQRRLN